MKETLKRINLNELSSTEKQALVKKNYESNSYFTEKFQQDRIKFSCEAISKLLRQEIDRLLLEKKIIDKNVPLEGLHEQLPDEMRAYGFDDGINKISTYFYDTDEQFSQTFLEFIRFIRQEIITEPFFFQSTPTIRIHCPNAKNSHHYPRYHADIGYGHPPEEINLWIPLTTMQGDQRHGFRILDLMQSRKILQTCDYDFSNFIEKAINNKQFSDYCESVSSQVDAEFGEILAFDSRCVHSGEALKQHTRASIDIRVLPVSEYEKMSVQYQGSGRRKILFMPGHCYHEKHSDLLI